MQKKHRPGLDGGKTVGHLMVKHGYATVEDIFCPDFQALIVKTKIMSSKSGNSKYFENNLCLRSHKVDSIKRRIIINGQHLRSCRTSQKLYKLGKIVVAPCKRFHVPEFG